MSKVGEQRYTMITRIEGNHETETSHFTGTSAEVASEKARIRAAAVTGDTITHKVK